MKKLEFLGVEFDKDQLLNWREHFDVIEDCDNLRLVSKKTFEHGEDNGVFNNFKYRFVIIVFGADYGLTVEDEKTGETKEAECYSAYLVPDMDYIHDSKVKSLQGLFGLDDMPLSEVRKGLSVADFAEEGYGVCLGEDIVEAKKNWNKRILNGYTTALETINSMRGFYLDQYVNRIGMTGWDFLEIAMSDKEISNFVCRH